jgi:myo-inositol-1(or 4)-monophosphatase
LPAADARPLAPLGEDAALLAEAAVAAGQVALGYFRRDPKVWQKAGDSPVSEADIAADRLLHARLLNARPDFAWLSEETADTAARLDARRLFVVDPIDGTRAFIAGDPVWAVSVAIVEDGQPVAAALYQPATDDLLVAARGRGAWRGLERLVPSARTALGGARFAGPRKALERFAGAGHALDFLPFVPSLALRIAYVADGRVDVAMASARAHDWDLAAAHLIVHEAGGRLTTVDGLALRYNEPEPRHPSLIAAAPGLASEAMRLVAAPASAAAAPASAPRQSRGS